METKTEIWWLPERAPVRPFGSISDYVQETLPATISSIGDFGPGIKDDPGSAKLLGDISDLFAGFTIEQIEAAVQSPDFRVCNLDVKMCAMALWHTGSELPEQLQFVLDTFCDATGDPKILTYEDIILSNPGSDLRTFFAKEGIGMSEMFFYRMHKLLEEQLIPVSDIIRKSIRIGFVSAGTVQAAAEKFGEVNRLNMVLRKGLDKQHFGTFRKFLSAVGSTKGPSGAFSGTFPLIDLMWLGSSGVFEGNKNRYRADNMYFPSFQRDEIQKLVNGSEVSIANLASSKTAEFESLGTMVKANMVQFFGDHLGSVKHHLPGVFSDAEKGTMGDNETGTYLKKSLRHRKKK